MALAAEESAKSKAAKEVIKSLTAQVFFLVYRLVSFELDFLEIVCSSLVNVLFVECFARLVYLPVICNIKFDKLNFLEKKKKKKIIAYMMNPSFYFELLLHELEQAFGLNGISFVLALF
jgi:uncharacterized protein YqhQ